MAAIAAGEESTSVASRRAARERLDRQRARSREQVEHPLARERPEDREQRLAHAVGGRPRRAPAGRDQRRSADAIPRSLASAHARIGACASLP